MKNKPSIFSNRIHLLFLVDAIGALVSALFLLFVLPGFEVISGFPTRLFNVLGTIALVFSIYSILNFFLKTQKAVFLRLIAIGNILYGCLSISLALIYKPSALTLTYLVLEFIILIFLGTIEIKASKSNS